jgi:small GTP-binding protein
MIGPENYPQILIGYPAMTDEKHEDREFKLVVFGAGGVGKSSLIIQLINNEFSEKYDPTLEDTYQKDLHVNDIKFRVNLVDTAGQEEYQNLRSKYTTDGDAFIIVYSVTDQSTFDEVEKFLDTIFQGKATKPGQDTKAIVLCTPILVIGNKTDLHERREVPFQEAHDMCTKYGIAHFECSAKKRENVEKSFEDICEQVLLKTKGNSKVDALMKSNTTKNNSKKKCSIM